MDMDGHWQGCEPQQECRQCRFNVHSGEYGREFQALQMNPVRAMDGPAVACQDRMTDNAKDLCRFNCDARGTGSAQWSCAIAGFLADMAGSAADRRGPECQASDGMERE